jgi:hypothetical protein
MIGVIGVDIDLFKRNDWVVNLTYSFEKRY